MDKDNAQDSSTPISDQPSALQGLADTIAFLAAHPPFSALPDEDLARLLAHARLRYYPEGEKIDPQTDAPPAFVAVVYQGLIGGLTVAGGDFSVGPGEMLLNVAAYEARPSRSNYTAQRDSFLIEIPSDDFLAAAQQQEPLKRYCERRASELIDLSRAQASRQAMLDLQAEASLDTPLRALASHPALECSADTPVTRAVAQMHDAGVGSIIISNGQRQVLGIFTLHDLRDLVARGAEAIHGPVGDVMTRQPQVIEADAPVYEAAATMAERRVRHLPVVAQGRLWGIVSERDLFTLQRGGLVHLSRALSRADSTDTLRQILREVHALSRQMLAHGASARQLTGIITRLNDAALARTINLVTQSQPWPCEVIWLTFGSEGRGEQTLATDQDNGLVLLEPLDDAGRAQALKTAGQINQALDDIGFPLCRGNTMASNPALCLSLDEWRARFMRMIQSPTPQHLLDATILLDARPAHGDQHAWHDLMAEVRALAADNSRFIRALARHALEWRPALNFMGRVRTQKVEDQRVVNLKKGALQPIIAAARVLAVAHQVEAINTEDRFHALAEARAINGNDARAWVEAFSFVQLQRMKLNQQQAEAGEIMDNDLDLATLNPLDKRILREALRQVGRLQRRLDLDYPA